MRPNSEGSPPTRAGYLTEEQREARQRAWEEERATAEKLDAVMADIAAARRHGNPGASEHDPSFRLPTRGREGGTEPEPPVYGLGQR